MGHAGLLLPASVLFASYDAVLYAFERGGNLAWRGALPSRPLSAPLVVEGRVARRLPGEPARRLRRARRGEKAGSFTTSAEIRTPPTCVAGGLIVLGLRDRSVIAYAPRRRVAAPGAAAARSPSTAPTASGAAAAG